MNIFKSMNEAFDKQLNEVKEKDLVKIQGTIAEVLNRPENKAKLNTAKNEGLIGNALKGAAVGALTGAVKGVLGESKEPEDLWDKIYGEITEDGTLKMVTNSKGNYMPQINKGAGYDYKYVTSDTDGNIVIRADREEDFKAAIDIADKYADKGVTYTINKSKYLKVRPYFMTIEIPYNDKEDLDEGLSVVDRIKKLHPEIFAEPMKEAKEPMNELFGIGEVKANYYVKKSDNEQFKEIDKKEFDNIVKAVKSLGDKAEIQKITEAEKKGDGTEFTVKVKRGNPGTYYGMKIERIGANKEEKKLAKKAENAADFEINVLSNGFVNIYNGNKEVATYESKEAAKAALSKLIQTVSKF